MTKTKSTKRALLLSALSLLMCVSMLIGSTFAWFTDSVTSSGNIIKSGTLDVEMYWKDAVAGEGTQDTYKNASEGAIFDYDLWEPGYVEAKHIQIKNVGSLALKYQLSIAATGEVSKLADVIDVYYAEGEIELGERTDMSKLSKLGKLTDVLAAISTTASGDLLEGETDTVTLALKMQETAGNEYQGLSIGSEFAVVLMATQLTSEFDSFDNKYDELAEYMNKNAEGAWEINSLGNLIYFAQQVNGGNSYAGETVVVTKDIDLNGINWTPIGNWDNTFNGTFDGQGYTISNLYINAPAGEGVGLFGVTQNATIKGVNIKNVDVTGYSMVSALVGAPYPSTISDCHVTGKVNLVAEWAYVGGIAGYCYYGTQVDNCFVIADEMGSIISKTRNAVGGITAWLLEGNHKVTNCQVKNLNLTGWTNIGGITGFVHYNNTIEGCSVENVKLTKTRADGNPGIGLIAGGWSYSASNAINLRNNTVKNATMEGNHVAYAAYNELYGSEYGGATTANFVLEGNTTENIKNNLIVVTKVNTAAALTAAIKNGENVVLAADVTVNANDAITVASGTNVTLDLNGHKISATANDSGNQELFLVKGNMTVKNGSLELTAENNQGWGAMATIFDVTAGGVLNLDGVTADVTGTDMTFVVHLNNWGTATLNAKNSTLKASYISVRAFNSGKDMNNITIENCTLEGKFCFWVHNYTAEGKDDSTLNVDIYGNGNTFVNSGKAPVLYGFDNTIYYDANGNVVA